MSIEWEQYEERYSGSRPETYAAYVDVWMRHPRVRTHFSGWAVFSQCANAEPQKRRDMPRRVQQAESIMGEAGYSIGAPTTRGARRWVRSA